jgi:hypothetical protein
LDVAAALVAALDAEFDKVVTEIRRILVAAS